VFQWNHDGVEDIPFSGLGPKAFFAAASVAFLHGFVKGEGMWRFGDEGYQFFGRYDGIFE
jgi:hypothetical protein